MQRPRFDILILNWNGLQDTLQCLESLTALDYPHYRVVLVDNGSSDGSVARIRSQYPQLTIVETGQNLGFAGGNNRGIERCLQGDADAVLLLNNDTIVDPHMLQAFAQTMHEHPQAGVLGAKIYYLAQPQTLWFAGSAWNWRAGGFTHFGINQPDQDKFRTVKPIDYACGCAMMVRREVFQKIGLLEERFFAVYEESDFCFRARRAGFECLFVPDAHVWHKISASFQGGNSGAHSQYYYARNRLLFIERNMGKRIMLQVWTRIVLPQLLGHLLTLANPGSDAQRRRLSKATVSGVLDYLRRRFGPGPQWLHQRSLTHQSS